MASFNRSSLDPPPLATLTTSASLPTSPNPLNPSSMLNTGSTSFHDYYDLDVILMEQQSIPVTFKMTVPGLGYLEGSNHQPDIREGTSLFLPLWLIESLALDGVLTPSLPKPFSSSNLKNLRASARSGNERKVQALSRALSNTLKDRFGWILDYTQTPLEEHTSNFVQGLDMSEKDILKRGQLVAEMYRRWTTSPMQLKTSSSILMVNRELGSGELP